MLMILFVGACSIVCLVSIPYSVKGLIILGCGLYAAGSVFQQGIRVNSAAIIRLWGTGKKDWQLENNRGEIFNGELCGDSIKTPYLVILKFIPSDLSSKTIKRKPLFIAIFYDALPKDSFRKLRSFL